MLGLLMLGGLFLIIKKYGFRKFISLIIFIIFELKLWNATFPKITKIVKIQHIHHPESPWKSGR